MGFDFSTGINVARTAFTRAAAACVHRLPYNLVLSLITNPRLQQFHLNVCSRAASIMRNLYIDNDIWPETPLEYSVPSSGTTTAGALTATALTHDDMSLEDAESSCNGTPRAAATTVLAKEPVEGGQKQRRRGAGRRWSEDIKMTAAGTKIVTFGQPAERHQPMVRVSNVRVWASCDRDASAEKLSAMLPAYHFENVNWRRFDVLKEFISTMYIGHAAIIRGQVNSWP